MHFPNMLSNQWTNTGVSTQRPNFKANGDNDILTEGLHSITSSDPFQNQTLDNCRPTNIELLVGAINNLQKCVEESKLCQEIVLNP